MFDTVPLAFLAGGPWQVMICVLFVKGYEEVHVPHLKAKPFESNEVPLFGCIRHIR